MSLLRFTTLLVIVLAATGDTSTTSSSSSAAAVDQAASSSAARMHDESLSTREFGDTNFLRKLTRQSAIPSSQSHAIDDTSTISSPRRRLGWWYNFFMEHFYPSLQPSRAPTMAPTAKPTARPSENPSFSPTMSLAPSSRPSLQPSPIRDGATFRLETATGDCPRTENCFNIKEKKKCNCQSHCKWANIGIEVCMPDFF
ncbi:hypothetical protein ACHAXS_003897 [Conticribra weissflogii]